MLSEWSATTRKSSGARQLGRLARGRRDLLALGEAIGIARRQPRSEGARIERERRVQMRVAEERPGREVAARIGRIGPLGREELLGCLLWSSVPTSRRAPDLAQTRAATRQGSTTPASRAVISDDLRHVFLSRIDCQKTEMRWMTQNIARLPISVGRQSRRPARQTADPRARDGRKRQHGGDEQQLARLDAEIEEQQGDRDMPCGHADLAQRPGEAEAVQQAEGKGHEPGRARGDAWPAVARMQDLRRHEHDRQRDHRLDRLGRDVDEAERRRRQRDAVRGREGGDGLHELPQCSR